MALALSKHFFFMVYMSKFSFAMKYFEKNKKKKKTVETVKRLTTACSFSTNWIEYEEFEHSILG